VTREFTVLHLFSGIGGAALGFQQSVAEYKGIVGRFRTLAGIDVDPEACADFEALTGVPAVQTEKAEMIRSKYRTLAGVKAKNKPGEVINSMIEIIKRPNGHEHVKEQLPGQRAQVSYNSDGHLVVRFLGSGGDILVMMSKSASDEVIEFCQKQLAGRERRFPF